MKKSLLMALMLLLTQVFAFSVDAKSSKPDSETTEVKSYTKKDGTVVKGYSRKKTTSAAPDTTEVKGYTKKDGTKVAGYTRKKPASK